MADQFDEILSAATGGTSEQLKPEASDEILRAAGGSPSSVSAPAPDPILAAAGGTQAPSYSGLFTEGIARNWSQMKAIPPSLQAMYEEYQGNQPGAVAKAQEAQGILKETGDSKYELFKNVHDPIDFSYWLTEKMGEQGVTALATLMTGGAGGLATGVVARQLAERAIISGASAKTLQLAGAMVPTYALSSAMEGANTSQEQFEVTGSPQAGLSAGAGLTKGLLELWAPMSIARSMISPGAVLGKTIPGAIGKIAAKEGSTEYAQELIDIAARKYSDPSYEFFGSGATPWYQGEGFLRAAEAGATGAAVGAVYGGPFAGAEARATRAKALGDQPVGERKPVDPLEGWGQFRREVAKVVGKEEKSPDVIMPDSRQAIFEIWQGNGRDLKAAREEYASQPQNVPTSASMEQGGEPASYYDRWAGIAKEALASDRVTITPAYANENSETWQVKSPYGSMHVRVNKVAGEAHISSSSLNSERNKGKGHGLALYKAVVDKALAEGYTVRSDDIVSAEAGRMYEALKRRGYKVEGPQGAFDGEEYFNSPKNAMRTGKQGVFQVTTGPVTAVRDMVLPKPPQDELSKEAKIPGHNVLQAFLYHLRSERKINNLQSNTAVFMNGLRGWHQDVKKYRSSPVDIVRSLVGTIGHHVTDTQRYYDAIKSMEAGTASPHQRNMVDAIANKAIQLAEPQDKLSKEAISKLPRDDVVSLGPLTSDVRSQETQREHFLNQLDRITPRYVEQMPDGSLGNRIFTDTELEFDTALNAPQNVKRKWLKVDHSSLQPAGITAHELDLADPASGKVWFADMPGKQLTAEQKQEMLERYTEIYNAAKDAQWATLQDANSRAKFKQVTTSVLGPLLTQGLRVVPSRGAGFFYNLGVRTEGSPVDNVRLTKRSNELAWYNPQDGSITPFRADESTLDIERTQDGLLVSLDLNKIEDKDIEKIMDGWILKAPFDPKKLVPGFKVMSMREDSELKDITWKAKEDKVQQYEVDPAYQKFADTIESKLKMMLPVIKDILRSIGINQPLRIIVTDQDQTFQNSPAAAFAESGAIAISPKNWSNSSVTGEIGAVVHFDTTLFGVVMHEVGHLVSYHYFNQLPLAQQDQLNYAWEKTLLSSRMGDFSRAVYPTEQATVQDGVYWSTFPEFLAEQFRRWATADVQARVHTEEAFQQIGEKLEKFYRAWENKASPREVLNLFNPDHHFSAVMDFLRGYGKDRIRLEQLMKQNALYQVPLDVRESPTAVQIATQVVNAIQSMLHMFPRDIQVHLNQQLNENIIPGEKRTFSEGAAARWIHSPARNLQLIELALGSLPEAGTQAEAAGLLSHELWHAYEALNLITSGERAILDEAVKGRENELFPASDRIALYNRIHKQANDRKLGDAWASATYRSMVQEEYRAYLIQDYMRTGQAKNEQTRTVISWILQVIERIRNFIHGLGYKSREDVVRAFFKGDMLARQDQSLQEKRERKLRKLAETHEAIDQARRNSMVPHSVVEVEPGLWMAAEYFGEEKGSSDAISYMFFERGPGSPILTANPALKKLGPLIGHVILEKDNRGRGYHVVDLASDRPGFARKFAIHILKDLGMTESDLIPPATASDEGKVIYAWGARNTKFKGVFDWYVKDKETGEWMSPNHIRDMAGFWAKEEQRHVNGQHSAFDEETVMTQLDRYRKLWAKVPKEAWEDPRLEEMFSLRRNLARDGVQGSILMEGQRADEAELNKSLGFPAGNTVDGWTASLQEARQLSTAQRASEFGMPMSAAAPESMLSFESRRVWERLTRYGNDPAVTKELRNIAHEQDRIGKFTKIWWTLDHLLWRNEHIQGLRNYRENVERMKQLGSSWLNRADTTAREWEKVSDPVRREAIAQTLFDLTEMNYLSQVERQNKTKRLPQGWQDFLNGQVPVVNLELDRLFKKAGLTVEDHPIVRQVQKDFMDFLTEVEAIRDLILQRAHGKTSQAYLQGRAALTKEMDEMRSKPYFPMVRFGEFTLTARDSTSSKVVWSNAYGTQSQRDAAVREVRAQYPTADLVAGRVDPRAQEFMGLPGPLIRMIKEKLPTDIGLSQADKDKMQLWLEEFEMLNAPDRSFRKRWMPSKGIPGHSMDAFRAYSHYFMYGSRYIARLAYMDELQSNINNVNQSVTTGALGNTAKRQAIVKYMRDHYQYLMEGGRDSGKFRAFASLWFLGFSPAAAAMNLTQPFMTLWPKITADFGLGKANAVFSQGLNALKATNGYAIGDQRFELARAEMVSQGYIDVGQAAELGAFAEGNNLTKLFSGTILQKSWRNLSYYGMKMFSATEHFNRELTFKVAYDLALQHAGQNHPVLQKIDLLSPIERSDLMKRVGLTYQEAIAFLYAKDAIKKTQFEFSKDTDAPFMRGSFRKNFLIFFKYTHSMLYALRFNGAMFQSMLLLAFLYGLQGLPSSDEANEVLRLLAKKLFGSDFDLHEKARSFMRDMTKGTVFNDTGPDLFMHGVSRYGFGLGLLPEGWGAPSFDASANGSMGRIVPGLAEFLHGVNTSAKGKDIIADSAQRAAGAGYGQLMAIMNFLMAPSAVDSHKWESLLPRFMRGWAAAYRYMPEGTGPNIGVPFLYPGFPGNIGVAKNEGAETTQAGAKIVNFNPTDPDDLAAIATQALGFKPTKVNETWEMIRNAREEVQVYNARKAMLYVQYAKAIQARDPAAVDDVIQAVRAYNDQVLKMDPNMAIKPDQLKQAMKQRSTSKELMEQFLASSKRDILVTERIKDLYPGVRTEKVK